MITTTVIIIITSAGISCLFTTVLCWELQALSHYFFIETYRIGFNIILILPTESQKD